VFPYSRQPDVRYVRPDIPLVNAPAMLFKDSIAGPTSPSTELPPTYGAIENHAASTYMTDRSIALGGSGSSIRISCLPSLT
jgi:hypothetical protein